MNPTNINTNTNTLSQVSINEEARYPDGRIVQSTYTMPISNWNYMRLELERIRNNPTVQPTVIQNASATPITPRVPITPRSSASHAPQNISQISSDYLEIMIDSIIPQLRSLYPNMDMDMLRRSFRASYDGLNYNAPAVNTQPRPSVYTFQYGAGTDFDNAIIDILLGRINSTNTENITRAQFDTASISAPYEAGQDDTICSICQEPYADLENATPNMPIRKLKNCPHRFHESCITTWALPNNKCPHCRTIIYPVQALPNSTN
jgi:hypothetical protein